MTCIGIGHLLSGHGERHERDHARTLHGRGDLALVLRAVPRDAARDDLPAVRDEVLQRLRVLVIDTHVRVGAEAADLPPREAALARSALRVLAAAAARTGAGADASTLVVEFHVHRL